MKGRVRLLWNRPETNLVDATAVERRRMTFPQTRLAELAEFG